MSIDARTGWTGPALALALALGNAAGGCAHRGGDAAQVDELNRTIHSLKAQNGNYQKQMEELENRVFILSDKLESKRVNAERAAPPQLPRALPTVTLRPSDKASESAGAASAGEFEEAEVEFVGDADPTKKRGRNLVLRLYGDETPVLTNVAVQEREVRRGPERPLVIAGEGESRPEVRPASGGRVGVSTALELYRRALDALRSGRHADAVVDFRAFIKQHPAHEFADNAQYWLAECFYDQKDYPAAVREFRRVVERFPQGNKVPDALLKAGFSHLAMGDTAGGKQTLDELVRSYPRHETAGRAEARLAALGGSSPPKTTTRSPRSAEEAP